jgi:hypothetical protein
MKRLLIGLAVLPFLAGVSLAASPVSLSDQQMDRVTAGFDFMETDSSDTSSVTVLVNEPLMACTDCYLVVKGTAWPSVSLQSLQVNAQFGATLRDGDHSTVDDSASDFTLQVLISREHHQLRKCRFDAFAA